MDNIKELTIEEKLKLLVGAKWFETYTANGKLTEIRMADGPHGVRKMKDDQTYEKSTAMPSLSLIANSWDRELAKLSAETIADECVELGVDVILAPGINIKRTPLCGRNFEYFSEDPYLTGELGKAFIKGVQDRGIGACVKHFVCNNCETDRRFLSSEVDKRTFNEIYLEPFRKVMEEKPWMVMSSYNPVNGVDMFRNKKMLKDVLRDKLKFDGAIVSDWYSVRNPADGVKATLDLTMPYREVYFPLLKSAYDDGYLTEEEIDVRVIKLLELIEKKKKADKIKKVKLTKEERHQNAVKIAEGGMVLLKNEDNILPIKSGNVLVLENYIKKNYPTGGGGSSTIDCDGEEFSFAEYIRKNSNANVEEYADSHMTCDGGFSHNLYRSVEKSYGKDAVLIQVMAKEESEGADRRTLKIPEVVENYIKALSNVNNNIVVMIFSGSAIDVSAFEHLVKGIIMVNFAGEGVKEALANIITGKTNPSGKLAETYPLSLEETPTKDDFGNVFTIPYKEGLFVGYRYYDSFDKEVRYPFGYGLSYTNFEYSDIKIDKQSDTDYEVSYTVKNVGEVDGREVSELYIRPLFSKVTRPEKELKAFSKDFIKAGEEKRVKVKLDFNSFAIYSTAFDKKIMEDGVYEVLVGASSRDIKLKGEIIKKTPDKYSIIKEDNITGLQD